MNKKVLIIMLIALVVIGGIVTTLFIMKGQSHGEYNWGSNPLCDQLPEPDFGEGELTMDEESLYRVNMHNTTLDDFNSYVELCEEFGYEGNINSDGNGYVGVNAEGYQTFICYNEDENYVLIQVACPEE